MYTFHLDSFVFSFKQVRESLYQAIHISQTQPKRLVEPNMIGVYEQQIGILTDVCRAIGMESVFHRSIRINQLLTGSSFTYGALAIQLNALVEAVEDDSRKQHFYHYPARKIEALLNFKKEWNAAVSNIEGIEQQAHSAVDCWAMGQNDACVFHLMKVMERSVQIFAQSLRSPITQKPTKGQLKIRELPWEQVLSRMKSRIDKISQRTLKGKRKFERYNALHAYLFSVKEAWRNPTMHPRDETYSDEAAKDILNHVRAFCNELGRVLKANS